MTAARVDVTARVRAIFLALPEVDERLSHGTPTWFIRGKKSLAMLWPDGHHQDDWAQLWCAAPPGAQQELIAVDAARYFRPRYVGHRGWIGVRMDGTVDWDEVAEIADAAFRVLAPKSLVVALDAGFAPMRSAPAAGEGR